MNKIIILPSSTLEMDKTKDLVEGYIIGIKNMCVNTNMCITLDELDMLSNYKDKDIFISLNKNMHNSDLDKIKEILIKLNDYSIKGVLYYDVAVLSIYRKLNLKYDLVVAPEHLITNYNTINYWHNFNVNYAYISSDITEEEIITISKNSKSKLMVMLFGYLPMFVSKRHIVKNYLEYFNLKDNSNINYMEKEDKIYPIVDDDISTQVYSNDITVIKLFRNVNKENVLEYYDKINALFNNSSEIFLNKKTIYRVKKNEK